MLQIYPMKRFKFILLILSCSGLLYAQQEAMYTHYMYNTLCVNPAYAGSRDALTMTLLHRSQWVGFEGAPTTETFSIHSPIKGDAVNLGLSVIADKVGPIRATGVYVDYAYRFRVSEKGKLSLGLKLGFNAYSSNLQSIKLNQTDNSFSKVESTFSPNIGLGVYYATDRYYIGASTPKLVKNNYIYSSSNGTEKLSKEARHYYFIAGGLIKLNKDIDLKPTTFVKVVEAAPIEADFTANFIFYDLFTLGAMYRTGDALGLLAGYNINEQLSVGYSFDWSFVNNTAKYNYGSHEVMLRYEFIYTDLRRIRSPRYF